LRAIKAISIIIPSNWLRTIYILLVIILKHTHYKITSSNSWPAHAGNAHYYLVNITHGKKHTTAHPLHPPPISGRNSVNSRIIVINSNRCSSCSSHTSNHSNIRSTSCSCSRRSCSSSTSCSSSRRSSCSSSTSCRSSHRKRRSRSAAVAAATVASSSRGSSNRSRRRSSHSSSSSSSGSSSTSCSSGGRAQKLQP
jgi:hypothetical protein